jgi:hypothetical protein
MVQIREDKNPLSFSKSNSRISFSRGEKKLGGILFSFCKCDL